MQSVGKNMTAGSPLKLILALSLPLMVANAFQQLYTVADTAIVGSVLVVFHQIYSSTLRVDIIYNYMFWMSIPFIMMREACLENSSPGDAEAGGSQAVCAAAAKR